MSLASLSLENITPQELMTLGSEKMAYVKEVEVDGDTVFGVFSADGRLLGALEDRQTAFFAAEQNQLEAVSVH